MDENIERNLLISVANAETNKILFKTSINLAEKGHTVLYISSKEIDTLPGSSENSTAKMISLEPDVAKKIIFIYLENVDGLITKLLDLHNWTITPSLVIIESLHTFFHKLDYKSFLKKHIFLIASLHNCIHGYANKMNSKCFSIISVDFGAFPAYSKLTPILMDLFYYKNNYIDNVDNLLSKLTDKFQM